MVTSNPNVPGHQLAPIVGVINPESITDATKTSDWVSMADYGRVMAVLCVGAIAATGTVDAKLEQAQDSSGTGAKDITGKAITQLTDADDNKQVVINLTSEELDVNNSFTHARLSVTDATAAAVIAAAVFGLNARYAPGDDLATVDEIVS